MGCINFTGFLLFSRRTLLSVLWMGAGSTRRKRFENLNLRSIIRAYDHSMLDRPRIEQLHYPQMTDFHG